MHRGRNFTGSELAEGIRRQMAIESEKAQQRIDNARRRDGSGNISTANGLARDKAGEAFGISGRQAEKVLYVANNADLLDPADFAKVGIYADQRIGEILRELPTRQGARNDLTSSDTPDKVTRSQAIEASGIERSQAYDLQKLAANPDVVQAVLDRAEAEGRNRGGMGPIHPDAYSMHAMS